MKTIPLSKGQVAIVDAEDFEYLNQWKWYANWCWYTASYYAERKEWKDGKPLNISMHRQILGLKRGDKRCADHKDHNTLDNRRKNIRIVTRRGNSENMRNQSKYGVGVRKKDRRRRPYQTSVYLNGKTRHVGYYETIKEAQEARQLFLDIFE